MDRAKFWVGLIGGCSLLVAACGGEATHGSSTDVAQGGSSSGGTASDGGAIANGGVLTAGGAIGVGGAIGAGGAIGVVGSGGSANFNGPFSCSSVSPTCDAILDFPVGSDEFWGRGDFTGGFDVFGSGLVRDTSVTDAVHIVGNVSNYGYGFVLWFASCSDLSSFSGISFRIGGRTGARNLIDFSVQTNSDYPWQAAPLIRRGACTSADPLDPWGACEVPTVPLLSIPAVPAMLIMPWSEISGGKPVTWSAATSPSELLGFQWTFPWSATATEYQVDITLDEIRFVGGSLTEPCPTGDVRH